MVDPGKDTKVTAFLPYQAITYSWNVIETEVLDAINRFGWDKSKLNVVDIASEYAKTVLSGEQKRVSIYEQRSKVKLKELIEIGSSGMPPIVKGDEDFLAILSGSFFPSESVEWI